MSLSLDENDYYSDESCSDDEDYVDVRRTKSQMMHHNAMKHPHKERHYMERPSQMHMMSTPGRQSRPMKCHMRQAYSDSDSSSDSEEETEKFAAPNVISVANMQEAMDEDSGSSSSDEE